MCVRGRWSKPDLHEASHCIRVKALQQRNAYGLETTCSWVADEAVGSLDAGAAGAGGLAGGAGADTGAAATVGVAVRVTGAAAGAGWASPSGFFSSACASSTSARSLDSRSAPAALSHSCLASCEARDAASGRWPEALEDVLHAPWECADSDGKHAKKRWHLSRVHSTLTQNAEGHLGALQGVQHLALPQQHLQIAGILLQSCLVVLQHTQLPRKFCVHGPRVRCVAQPDSCIVQVAECLRKNRTP